MYETSTKVDKVIVTNLTALKAKYGVVGAQKVETAVKLTLQKLFRPQ